MSRRRRRIAWFLVLAVAASAGGCKDEPEGGDGKPEADAALKSATPDGPTFSLTELHRTETPTRSHVSRRAVLADLPVKLTVKGLPDGAAKPLLEGFCATMRSEMELQCKPDEGKAKELIGSELELSFEELPNKRVVEMGGSTLLTEGWESASLYLRLGITTSAEADEHDYWGRLGIALARRWLHELASYLKRLHDERPPSPAVKWLAAPGFQRDDLWPLDYGFATVVGDRAWTFQKSKEKGTRVGFLIDEGGEIGSVEEFDAGKLDSEQATFATRVDPRSGALIIVVPVDPQPAKGDAPATPAGYHVVGLTREGRAQALAAGLGKPVSPALMGVDSVVHLVVERDGQTWLDRIDPMTSKATHDALPKVTPAPERWEILWLGERSLLLMPGPPSPAVLVAQLPEDGSVAVSNLWIWMSPAPEPRRDTPHAAADGAGGVVLLDHETAVRVGADRKPAWQTPLDGTLKPREIAVAGDWVVTLGDGVQFLNLSDGREVARDRRRAFTALPDGDGGVVACADPGLVAYDAKLRPAHTVAIDDHCEQLGRRKDGGWTAARFIWVLGLGPTAAWR